ncbi:single-stranded DNA-binding protein [Burkholderia multivorans]|uniref:single-stranded DNA-binding protein n=1 Tax=Burkholderia multivorans TaxID=87883 RepID=UPI001C2433CA|nr:single-stranded DNA-binding protein [Burkholderia multivorans]MBU9310840.1 single-stranded DNA-binding protein [Burkholderia multivorans]MBU9366701.1 single-stranded DNA-binding protein [Burkholderia multivorans]MDN7594579.1 single-stranded DNA-binding protein [Burkholderia multivorans]MDN7870000.1 single-stranded DNA-binding protein [Burkholderia multivorans]
MIDGLVSGKLYGTATSRTGASGKAFVTAKVRAAAGDGESLFVNVIAFSTTAGEALLALGDGDSVALAGTLTPKVWTNRDGETKPALDMVAHAVLTAYHVKRKRAAMQGRPSAPETTNGAEQAGRIYGGADDMNDDL